MLIEEKKRELIELLQSHADKCSQMSGSLMPVSGVYKGDIVVKATVYKLTEAYILRTLPDIEKTPRLIHENFFAKATPKQIAERIVAKALENAQKDVQENADKYLAEVAHRVH